MYVAEIHSRSSKWMREMGLKFRSFSQYTLVALVLRAGITQGKPPTIELAHLRQSSKQVSFFFSVLSWLGLLAFIQVYLHMAPWDIPFKDCGSFRAFYLCGQNQEPKESKGRWFTFCLWLRKCQETLLSYGDHHKCPRSDGNFLYIV